MKAINFKESNVVLGEGQEYRALPALKLDGETCNVISCWKLSFWERLKVLFTGKIWVSVLTYKMPVQPLLLTTKKPFKYEE